MVPFAPEIAVPALKTLQATYGNLIYSTYGFVDAFNPTFTLPIRTPLGRVDRTRGWFDTDFLGIDEGPLVAMIENYRTELVWTTMRRNRYIIRGLQRAGFAGGWLDHVAPSPAVAAAPTAPARAPEGQPTPAPTTGQPSSGSPPSAVPPSAVPPSAVPPSAVPPASPAGAPPPATSNAGSPAPATPAPAPPSGTPNSNSSTR